MLKVPHSFINAIFSNKFFNALSNLCRSGSWNPPKYLLFSKILGLNLKAFSSYEKILIICSNSFNIDFLVGWEETARYALFLTSLSFRWLRFLGFHTALRASITISLFQMFFWVISPILSESYWFPKDSNLFVHTKSQTSHSCILLSLSTPICITFVYSTFTFRSEILQKESKTLRNSLIFLPSHFKNKVVWSAYWEIRCCFPYNIIPLIFPFNLIISASISVARTNRQGDTLDLPGHIPYPILFSLVNGQFCKIYDVGLCCFVSKIE